MKKISWLLFAAVIILTVTLSISARTPRKDNQALNNSDFNSTQKLAYAERLIESFYVDSVNSDELVEEAIISMLKTLDPHSSYSNADETKELTTPLQGNFSGIGIQFNMNNDTLYVIQTTVGGPSERVGIQPGDRILSANDSVLSGVKRQNADVLRILRGPKGTEVIVNVLRKGTPEPIKFRIIRDDIPLYSVDASYMADKKTGYIRVSRFAESTGKEVEKAVKELQTQGMENLIIDLEDNGGGYLNAAYEMASLFLPKGSLVVYTDGPRVPRTDYRVDRNPVMPEGKLVVLVNQNSASASEIFAGAIQDNDRGLVVGRRTFGKGLVQRPFPFPDGSMIRLTVSRYYTPAGRSIQKPYVNGDAEDYYMDIYNRYKGGEFENADSVHFADSLKVYTLVNLRPVYGGGGIMPDKFVAVDTTGYSKYYRDMMANGIFNRYVVNYVDQNRELLKKKYSNEREFVDKFQVTPAMIEGLGAMGEKEGVAPDPEGLKISRTPIEAFVKGLIARDLWDMSGYYMTVNPVVSPVYREGLSLISNDRSYNEKLNGSSEQ